jgi:CubicO group peptidase (beta-lactamase class C family)
VFLGQIIEQLTTDDYEVYIDKNIFKPLEMYRSYFDDTPYHLQPHKAQSYLRSAGQLRPMRPETNTGITVANGGWNAPLGDLVKYVSFVIGDPARRDVYDGVLKRASLEEMFQPQLPSGGDGSPNSIGLTFFIEPRSGRTLISHSGGQNGFATRWGVDFASRSAYIMAFNTIVVTKTADEPNLGTVMSRVRNALIDNVFPTLEGRRSSAAR